MLRALNAVALSILLIFRPSLRNEPIPRDNVLSLRKLSAEGRLEETKIVLGWTIDTRKFLIKLPEEKALRWLSDIDEIIKSISDNNWISLKEWESLIGKCNTAAYIIRESRFFLSRFRYQINEHEIQENQKVQDKKSMTFYYGKNSSCH